MKTIWYSPHLKFRLTLREIPEHLPKEIYERAKERYVDAYTNTRVAIRKVSYKEKMREWWWSIKRKKTKLFL